MTSTELFQAGKLTEAIAAQIAVVKDKPADHKGRLFLFELLAFSGDLERAKKHLDLLNFDEIELAVTVEGYRKLLASEAARREVFKNGAPPQFLEEPPEHLKMRLEALGHLRLGNAKQANDLLIEAEAQTPVLKGKYNDKPFELIRDADDIFGAVIEVMAKGNYFWVPLEQIELIQMNPPKSPRDVLWRPVILETKTGSAGDAFMPSLYPGSHESADEQIKLGRMTDWRQVPDGPTVGIGTHTFLVGDDAASLLDWKKLEIE